MKNQKPRRTRTDYEAHAAGYREGLQKVATGLLLQAASLTSDLSPDLVPKGLLARSLCAMAQQFLDESSAGVPVAQANRAPAAPPEARRGPGRPRKYPQGFPSTRHKGQKRDPSEIEATVAKVKGYVRENPGRGVEQIGKSLGIATKDLALPVKKLIAAKAVRTKGKKRATKYFPA